MKRERIPETDRGIQGEANVASYDEFMRYMRDGNRLQIEELASMDFKGPDVLEVGPGCGYVGLELLKRLPSLRLTGLDISPDMIVMAEKNAGEYGLKGRTRYVASDGRTMPFEDASFQSAFSRGSLHEWADPGSVLSEMRRVTKPGGLVCVIDMRRDAPGFLTFFIGRAIRPKEMRGGFYTSLRAAYTKAELSTLMKQAGFHDISVHAHGLGLSATARV